MNDDSDEFKEYPLGFVSLLPLIRVGAVVKALFTFFGLSLAGGGSLTSHLPGLCLLGLAALPSSAVRRFKLAFVASLLLIAVGATLTVLNMIRYREFDFGAIDLLLFLLFLAGFVLARQGR
jgi:hypothetical protein